MEKQQPWFDDPEWEDLRKKTSKKSTKTPSVNTSDNVGPPAFLRQPSAQELRRAMERPRKGRVSSIPARPQTNKPPTTQLIVDTPARMDNDPKDDRPAQISINLSLPGTETFQALIGRLGHLSNVLKKAVARLSQRQLVIATSVPVLALMGFGIYKVLPHKQSQDQGSEVLSTKVEKPTYPVTKPTDTQTDAVKFDPEKQVASYADKINGVSVTVSQQPLPEKFKSDPYGELEKLAKSFSANESFVVDDFKVYIGTSIKGPQSVILVKDKKLIFIQSASKISSTKWVEYIQTLKAS